jgi:hypothetical protein
MARHEPGVGARGLMRVGEAVSSAGTGKLAVPYPGCPLNIKAWPEIVPRGEALAPAAAARRPSAGSPDPAGQVCTPRAPALPPAPRHSSPAA